MLAAQPGKCCLLRCGFSLVAWCRIVLEQGKCCLLKWGFSFVSGCHVVFQQGRCCLLSYGFRFGSGCHIVLEQGKCCLMCFIPACRLSPKAGRKDRGRQLRSKRERASSPSAREAPLMRARSSSASLILDRAREPVKQVGTKHEVEYFSPLWSCEQACEWDFYCNRILSQQHV